MKKSFFVRLLSMVLTLVTIVATISVFTFEVHGATGLTEEQFASAIAAAKKEYPHNYYWNEYNGKDADGIAKAGTIKCKGTSNYNDKNCSTNGYCAYGGTSCTCSCGYYHGWQCFGFGNLLAYKTLGSWATNSSTSASGVNSAAGWKYYSSVTEYYAGDFVRINNNSHTIFVYKVEGNNVYYAECNATGPCKINWEGQKSISKLKAQTTFVVHKTGNTLKGTGASSDTSSDYIATDFNPTIKDGIYTLKIAHTSGTMLNVYNGTKDWANNPALTTWKKDDTGEQKFYFKHESNGKYRIYAVCSGANGSVYNKVVDVNIGPSTNDVLNIGDSFDIWDKTSSFDYCQLFYIVHVGNGKYVIELASTPNAVLAAKTAETAATNGGAITLREYNEYTTQQWYFYNESGTAPVDPSINNSLTYTVNYNTNGGSNPPSTQSKLYGTTLTLSSTIPTKVGYSFVGWSTSNDTTVEYQAGAAYTADADVTLYAVWKADEYTVSYNANGGTNSPVSQTKVHDIALTLSSTIPAKSGYSFVGWSTSNDTTVEYQAGATYTANADVTLYAVWKADEYTVSYNSNGGSNAPSSQTKVYEKTLILSDIVPTKTGYTFMGWATSSNSTNVIYQEGDSYSNNSDLTLYAVWKENVALDDSDDDIDNETPENKETIENKETVIDTNDNSNVNNDIKNNNDDKDNETEQKKSGCNSSIALSGLFMISVLGLVFVRKSQKKTNSNRKS